MHAEYYDSSFMGLSWLGLFTLLMLLMEFIHPVGFMTGVTASFVERPFTTAIALVGAGVMFAVILYITNEALYRIARRHNEPQLHIWTPPAGQEKRRS